MRVFLSLSLAFAGLQEMNPITRVAQLLQGLADKIEQDGKAEQKLYDEFVCWCKTVQSQKTKSNEVAAQRIADLEAYIDDIKNGRVEFTTEREDLAKEVQALQNQLEQEKAQRDQAHKDFVAAEKEMDTAQKALGEAIDVLASATEDSKEGVLLGVRFALRKVSLTSNANLESLNYLERMINEHLQPKDKDWEKLDSKKMRFSKKYKGRSFKLQQMLADMKKTFEDNLAAAREEEKRAQEDYDKLREQKKKTLKNRKDAAASLKAESAARNKSRGESEAERDALKEQKANDEKTLIEVTETCQKKKDAWTERKRLQSEEVASIAQAISILRSDDARDLFKRSFDSQTPDFVQLSVSRCEKARRHKALRILANMHNERLRVMALLFANKVNKRDFPQNVIVKIDAILADLVQEAENDETEKHDCEELRATKTNEAKEHSNSIDENTDEITRQNALVEKLTASIAQKNQTVNDIRSDVAAADEQRAQEHAEFVTSKIDDEAAVGLIEKAVAALKKFYTDNELALLAVSAPPTVVAGEAPPPPPTTWDEEYGGAKGEHTGVVAIMELIKEDVKKDIKVAQEEEDKAESEHQAFVKDSNAEISSLESQIAEHSIARADAKSTIQSEEDDRDASKAVLADTINAIIAEEPKCDFITVNFQVRKENRAAEVDGLEKAKAVLSGASFGFLEC
eukprot:GEMP01021995.1.p1 GENE.GEMP01021995.1~~GEMP01021995.1.p1  ORF type:complete len:685 (+),score=234.48 GEMP01021995.1:181-2235(+)